MFQEAYPREASAKLSPPSVPSPISQVEMLNNRIGDLTARAQHLTSVLGEIADRLFGSRPEGANGADCQPVRCGRIGDVQDSIDRLGTALDAAASQADRLTSL